MPPAQSESEKEIANYVAEKTAELVMKKIYGLLLDEKFVSEFFSVWGTKIDSTLGRGLRRLGFYVLVIAVGLAVIKLGLVEKLLTWKL